MSKTNTDIVLRHHHELWSGGNIDSIGDYYAPDFVGHHPGAPDWVGPEQVREVMLRTREAFPDFREVVEDVEKWGMLDRFGILGPLQGFAPTGQRWRWRRSGYSAYPAAGWRRLRWFADDRSAGSAASAVNFNAPVVLRTDRARAKTRKQDTTRPRNRFLLGADSQLCHR